MRRYQQRFVITLNTALGVSVAGLVAALTQGDCFIPHECIGEVRELHVLAMDHFLEPVHDAEGTYVT